MQDLTAAFAAFNTSLIEQVDAKIGEVKKSFPDPTQSREGVGRVGQISPTGSERESNPVEYLIKKAESGEELSIEDKDLIAEITLQALTAGLDEQ